MDTQSIISNKIATMLKAKDPIVKITYVVIETTINADDFEDIDDQNITLASSVHCGYFKYEKGSKAGVPRLFKSNGTCRYNETVSNFCKKKFYILNDIDFDEINYEYKHNINVPRPVCIIDVERIC